MKRIVPMARLALQLPKQVLDDLDKNIDEIRDILAKEYGVPPNMIKGLSRSSLIREMIVTASSEKGKELLLLSMKMAIGK